jgi:hypothetical protein
LKSEDSEFVLGATLIDREEELKECQQEQELIQHVIEFLEKPDFFDKFKSTDGKAQALSLYTQPSSGSKDKEHRKEGTLPASKFKLISNDPVEIDTAKINSK